MTFIAKVSKCHLSKLDVTSGKKLSWPPRTVRSGVLPSRTLAMRRKSVRTKSRTFAFAAYLSLSRYRHRYVYIYCQCSVAAKGRWSVAVQSMVLGRSPGHHNQTVNSFMTLFLPSTEPPPCSPGRSVFEVVMSVNDVMFLFLNDFGPPLLMAY